jgi:hypothetical protein
LFFILGFISNLQSNMRYERIIGIERAEEEKDRVRRERLVAQGVHHGRGGIHEKMLNQDVLMGRPEGLRSDGVHRTGDGDGRARRNGAGGIGGARTRSMSNQLAI